MTESRNRTSAQSSRPTDSANAARRDAANKNAVARLELSGSARAVASLAKLAAPGLTAAGLNLATAVDTSDDNRTLHISVCYGASGGFEGAKL